MTNKNEHAPVDVISVLNRAYLFTPPEEEFRREIKDAIAAVAELIAQRDAMANALVTYRKAGVGNSTDFMLQHEASQLAQAALARVGGAK